MKRLSPDQIRQVYDRGPDAVVDLVTPLCDAVFFPEVSNRSRMAASSASMAHC